MHWALEQEWVQRCKQDPEKNYKYPSTWGPYECLYCVSEAYTRFREKNKDTLHQDLAAVMQQSQAEVVLALFPSEAPERESKRAGKPKAKGSDTMTVGFGCLRG